LRKVDLFYCIGTTKGETEMIDNKDIYRCYSVNLMQFLSQNYERYILIAKDIKSDRQFWAYVKTDRFNDLLQQWINNNPKK
jgi:hypothetical protein